MRKLLVALVMMGCFVPIVSADAFSSWSAFGDAWKATNDTHTLVMWNATGAHTWLAAGNATEVEYLVVGAGGASSIKTGSLYSSGGGGGEVKSGTDLAVSGSINVYVAPATANGGDAVVVDGLNSTFSTIVARGGKGGSVTPPYYGGACGDATHTGGSGSGTSGGGGGSNLENGFGASSTVGGAGANGTPSYITGGLVYYARGGPGSGSNGDGALKLGIVGSGGYGLGLIDGESGVVIISYLTPIPTFSASFTSSSNPSTVNTAVSFTDTSTGTPTTWNWTIAGSITNTTQNAAYLFDTIGTYAVDLNVTNASGHFSNYTLNQVVTNVSGFTPQDIWMEGQYLQTFNIVDSNNLPIANVTIGSTSGNSYTTSNGTGYLTEPFGAATVTFVSDGYTSRAISYVFDSDDTHSVTMYTATPPASSNVNTLYSPQTVHLTIVDAYGVPQPGAYVTVSYIASSLPSTDTNWLTTNFGVDSDVAADMTNSSVLQRDYTGSDGGFVFTAFPVIRYNITAFNATAGMNHRTEITPKDSHYVIYCPLSGQTRGNNTLIARQNATLPWYSLNNTHIMLGMTYQDTTSCTSSVRFRAWFQTNGSEIHNTTWSGFGSALILDNHTILKAPIGTEYLWQYNATRVC